MRGEKMRHLPPLHSQMRLDHEQRQRDYEQHRDMVVSGTVYGLVALCVMALLAFG